VGETYQCLACAERPIFGGKVSAYHHAREVHRGLLEDCHVEELFEVRSGALPDAHEDASPPFYCCHEGCDQSRMQTYSIQAHVRTDHGIKAPQHGEDYVSETEKIRREGASQRERERLARVEGDRAARVLETVVGVADFLTECGA
jgi:hypothetical protein